MSERLLTVGLLKERLKHFDDNLPVAYGSSELFTGAKGACTYFTEQISNNGFAQRNTASEDCIEFLVIV